MTLSIVEMIEEAYERIQIDPRAGYDMRSAKRSLNILLSEWTNRGLTLWTVEQGTYPLPTGTSSVVMNTSYYDVLDAALRDTSVTPNFDITLDRISPTDYLSNPFKDMRGFPTQFVVNRTFNSATITVWQVPNRDYTLVVNQLKIVPTVLGYTSAVEIPERYQAAMISGLAHQLALKKNPGRSPELKAYYEEDFERASAEDRDRSSFFVAPEINR